MYNFVCIEHVKDFLRMSEKERICIHLLTASLVIFPSFKGITALLHLSVALGEVLFGPFLLTLSGSSYLAFSMSSCTLVSRVLPAASSFVSAILGPVADMATDLTCISVGRNPPLVVSVFVGPSCYVSNVFHHDERGLVIITLRLLFLCFVSFQP